MLAIDRAECQRTDVARNAGHDHRRRLGQQAHQEFIRQQPTAQSQPDTAGRRRLKQRIVDAPTDGRRNLIERRRLAQAPRRFAVQPLPTRPRSRPARCSRSRRAATGQPQERRDSRRGERYSSDGSARRRNKSRRGRPLPTRRFSSKRGCAGSRGRAVPSSISRTSRGRRPRAAGRRARRHRRQRSRPDGRPRPVASGGRRAVVAGGRRSIRSIPLRRGN